MTLKKSRRGAIPVLEKFKFIRKYKALSIYHFHEHPNEKCLVFMNIAKKELGYAKSTYSMDIFHGLKTVFDQYKEYFVDGKPLHDLSLSGLERKYKTN